MKKTNFEVTLKKIEGKTSFFEKFYQETAIEQFSDLKIKKKPGTWVQINFKGYPRFPKYLLPELKELSLVEEIIKQRVSSREFTGKPIDKKQLSRLLLFSSGILNEKGAWNDSRRGYPSAGARYPLEVYVVIPRTEDLPAGIYHYNVKLHSLEQILRGKYLNRVAKIAGQKWAKKASVVFIISAVHRRTSAKYTARAMRYIFIEAGHLAQNLYLLSTAYGLGCCAIGGFNDREINSLLDIKEEGEAVIYMIAIGVL